MTYPTAPLPREARAILVLPAGLRALEHDLPVGFPVPDFIDLRGDVAGRYDLMHIHHAGECDQTTRALYVLGGRYLPHGAGELRLDPDEACEQ